MKKAHIIFTIALGLAVVIATILMKQRPSTVSEHEMVAHNASNSMPSVTNLNKVAEASVTTNASSDQAYSLKIKDPGTGLCAIVGLDKQNVTLKDKNGHVIWTVNLTNVEKADGLPVGWYISDGHFAPPGGKPLLLVVEVGFTSFLLDLDSGKATLGPSRHIP